MESGHYGAKNGGVFLFLRRGEINILATIFYAEIMCVQQCTTHIYGTLQSGVWSALAGVLLGLGHDEDVLGRDFVVERNLSRDRATCDNFTEF